MRLRRFPFLLVVIFVGGGIAAAAAIASNQGAPEQHPPISQEKVLDKTVSDSALGLTLNAPKDGESPAIPAEDAVTQAWKEEGAPGQPEELHATFALLSWGDDFKETPVWVLTYLGAGCIPAVGGPGDPYTCEDELFQTIMNATTGEYIASVTSPELGAANL